MYQIIKYLKPIIKTIFYPYFCFEKKIKLKAIDKENPTVIMLFHDIGYENKDRYCITPQIFETYINCFIKWNYKFVALDAVLEQLRNGGPYKEKQVVFTFDDGLEGIYTYGFELFKKYGIKPTIFLTEKYLNKHFYFSYNKIPSSEITEEEVSRYDGFKISYLKDEQIKELIHIGADIGAHTINHMHLTELPDDLHYNEITAIKSILDNRYRINVKNFAYPYGDFNAKSVRAAKKTYMSAVSIVPDTVKNCSNLYELPRIEGFRDELTFIRELFYSIKRSS